MPDPLEALLRSVGEVLAKLFGNAIEWIIAFFKNVWAVHLMCWSIVFASLEYIFRCMDSAWDYLGGMAATYGPGADSVPAMVAAWQFTNSILPITELFAFTVVYFEISILLAGYRFIKSWIPLFS